MSNDKIELIPNGHPVGPLTWEMSLNGGKAKGRGDYPVVYVPAKETGTVTYTIAHPGSIAFAQTNTFCAQAGLNKPTGSCDGQFTYTGAGTTKLVVTDANTAAGKYTYVINFNDNTPQLDPIYNNGGNGIFNPGPAFSASYIAGAAIVILVLVVIAVFAWRKFGPQENTTKGP
jgi:hypothetical protein